MSFELIKRLALLFVLCAVQILFLNHIRLFGVATPMLYILFVIIFHRSTPKWAMLLWSFTMGLAIDVFSNSHISWSCSFPETLLMSCVSLPLRWELGNTSLSAPSLQLSTVWCSLPLRLSLSTTGSTGSPVQEAVPC